MTIPPAAGVLFMGLGATLAFDLWGLLLKRAFGIPPSNMCLIGRWILYMPRGTFMHSTIVSTPARGGECIVGWAVHYAIGVMLATVFLAVVGSEWLRNPTPIPAIVFGVASLIAPFGIMQPAFGFGFAASRTPNPAQARLRSLMNHLAFGMGLYLFARVLAW